jgi:ribosomal protein L7Ae-like RNA K-turn-binding protein
MSSQGAKSPKKKRRNPPKSFLENESLISVVGLPSGMKPGEAVTTPLVTDLVKEIFLERFTKEIVQPFSFLLHTPRKDSGGFIVVGGKLQKRRSRDKNEPTAAKSVEPTNETNSSILSPDKISKRQFVRKRLVIGTNQCSRVLQQAHAETREVPSLMVMARDIYPPTMLAHAPALARALNIPLLLIGGKASSELGKALGTKKTSIMLFLPSSETACSHHSAMNSFIDFVVKKIPKDTIHTSMI